MSDVVHPETERRQSVIDFSKELSECTAGFVAMFDEHRIEEEKVAHRHEQLLSDIRDSQLEMKAHYDTRFDGIDKTLDHIETALSKTTHASAMHTESIVSVKNQNKEQYSMIGSVTERVAVLETKQDADDKKPIPKKNGNGSFWMSPNGRICLIIIAISMVGFFGVLGIQIGISDLLKLK